MSTTPPPPSEHPAQDERETNAQLSNNGPAEAEAPSSASKNLQANSLQEVAAPNGVSEFDVIGPARLAATPAHLDIHAEAPVEMNAVNHDAFAHARVAATGMAMAGDPITHGAANAAAQPDPSNEFAVRGGLEQHVSTAPPPAPPAFPRMQARQPDYSNPYGAKPSSSSRTIMVVLGILIFLGVASGVGLNVWNGMEQARIQGEVKTSIVSAQAAFDGKDVSGAAQQAAIARKQITDSTQPLDAGLIKEWDARIAHFNAMKAESDELDAIFAESKKAMPLAEAEKALQGIRARLESKKGLYGDPKPDNQPVVKKVDELLSEVAKLELKNKLMRLNEGIAEADTLYRSGKIEQAAERATVVARAMKEKPEIQDVDLDRRVSVLNKRALQLKALKELRLTARGDNYADVRRKIQLELSKLDETNADLKPLAKRLGDLKAELVQEEKRSRKLSTEEVGELKKIVELLAARDSSITVGDVEGDSINMKFDGKPLRMGFQRTALNRNLFVEVQGNRLIIEPRDLDRRSARVLRHAVALGAAMKAADVSSDELWNATEDAPLVSARRSGDDGREYIFLGDRLFVGKPAEKTASEKEVEADFAKKAAELATAVENDAATAEEVRRVMAVTVQATHKEADWHDHLPGKFVRKVVADGYIETNMPGTDKRLAKQLAAYREAYAKINHPGVRFSGVSDKGDEAVEMKTFEELAIWRIYEKEKDSTTFAIKNPDSERTQALFILYDFAGKLSEFPADKTPKTVRMTHQALGVTATFDQATQKMSFDQKTWDLAASLEAPMISTKTRLEKGLGTPEWSLPPHVLLVDQDGGTRGIVTPYGRLDAQDFMKIPDPAQRKVAMDKFLDNMAKVLPRAEYLHLYFRYFLEYILDSPITSKPDLLGSRAHCGDMHQTTEQSLMRYIGGRYVGDCDDLAEFFVSVTRRQNKLSYVMALPQHAAAGWAEKDPGASEYTFYIIDTGPPRMFRDKELDKTIETASRAYDDTNTMRFDPKSLGFLFRFNGEPTRSPYYLSSRMYTDRAYGETMERVQGYWHFHFYALGVQKMTEMIEKGDRVPENCIELAGLYGQVREVESSIKWTKEALKQFSPDERLSRMSEEFRIAMLWRDERDFEKSYESIKNLAAELRRLQNDPETMKYFSTRLQLMGLLTGIDRPWEAWELVQKDMLLFANKGFLKIEHVGGLTSVYIQMKKMIKAGKTPNATEARQLNTLEQLLTWFYSSALFEPEDDFNDYMRKYAFIGNFYSGQKGSETLTRELLKGGPFPDPAKKRNHAERKGTNPEAEDWDWIRLSLHSYSIAIGDALDLDDPPEKWRRDEAVKLTDAMLKAADHARKFGSLASSEFQLLSTRVFRAFLIKDWKDFEKVLVETEERDWARLTSDISETFGRSARFVTPQEFAEQYRVFAKHIKARTSFFTVIYEAYRSDGIEQAVAASKVALEFFPNDEDMKREAVYLEDLAKKKLAAKKAKAAAPAASPDGGKVVPEPTPATKD